MFFEEAGAALFGRRGKDGGQDARSSDGTRVFQAKHHQDGSAAKAIAEFYAQMARVESPSGSTFVRRGTEDHHLPWSFLGVHRHSSGGTVEVLHIDCNLHEPGGAVADDAEERVDA